MDEGAAGGAGEDDGHLTGLGLRGAQLGVRPRGRAARGRERGAALQYLPAALRAERLEARLQAPLLLDDDGDGEDGRDQLLARVGAVGIEHPRARGVVAVRRGHLTHAGKLRAHRAVERAQQRDLALERHGGRVHARNDPAGDGSGEARGGARGRGQETGAQARGRLRIAVGPAAEEGLHRAAAAAQQPEPEAPVRAGAHVLNAAVLEPRRGP